MRTCFLIKVKCYYSLLSFGTWRSLIWGLEQLYISVFARLSIGPGISFRTIYGEVGSVASALCWHWVFYKETVATPHPRTKRQNFETLYKCQISRFLSDPLSWSSRISIGGDVFSAPLWIPQKALPVSSITPSLAQLKPGQLSLISGIKVSQGPDKQADKLESMPVFHRVLSRYHAIVQFN